jgi:hypothetical protein
LVLPFPFWLVLRSWGLKTQEEKCQGKKRLLPALKAKKLFAKNPASLSSQLAATPNREFKFQKRRQLFIRVHNETLSVIAVRVSNPDRSPTGINR